MSFPGDLLEAVAGIQGHRAPDVLQQLYVVAAVRVKKALLQVCTGGFCKGHGRLNLALAEAGGFDHGARENAVFYLQTGTEHMVYIQVPGRRLHLVGGRGADNGHCVPHGLVGSNQLPGFGVDQPGNFLPEQAFAVAAVFCLTAPLKVLGMNGHQGGEAHVAQSKPGHCPGQFVQFIGLQLAPGQGILEKYRR